MDLIRSLALLSSAFIFSYAGPASSISSEELLKEITVTPVRTNSWMSGQTLFEQFEVSIANDSDVMICRLKFEFVPVSKGARLDNYWNLEKYGDSYYRTSYWLTIRPDATTTAPGLIVVGDFHLKLLTVREC